MRRAGRRKRENKEEKEEKPKEKETPGAGRERQTNKKLERKVGGKEGWYFVTLG